MKTYSMDLRERVVAACDARVGTRGQIAARFSVSVSWVRGLMRRRRGTRAIAPRPRGGGRARAFDGEADRRLREAVQADADATLAELTKAARGRVRALGRAPCSEAAGAHAEKIRGGRPSRTAPR